ncbi:ABC-F family ATP-binding cassette domain-containing protein [Vibrio sonorensis]|uniref:ABC-F family ATP-binding cassette domain-containing protein n=1 Tax=Vibrio sonorensis TaxID=1004316 RepID=UPI0008D942A3|nr:ABC-F family ATP-binding cassette domain-containing protein [Vibrio sonorensis]
MSTFLTAQSLTLSHSSAALFKSLSFTVNRGDKIGLIGHNGCGKSSLLKLLDGQFEPNEGTIAKAKHCLMSYVEQHIPQQLQSLSILAALTEKLADGEQWRAELLLSELGFSHSEWQMPVSNCSGGQQMRLLLARAIIGQPDLLLLDEPSNHLDLPSLIWLEQFLLQWKGSFILVSHDQALLDAVTNTTWVLRNQSLNHFALPCSSARAALKEKDEQDRVRHFSEQKEIDRLEKSAKRMAEWGKVYDNDSLARKAKTIFARKERLEDEQTELSRLSPWQLKLKGDALPANRLVEVIPFAVKPPRSSTTLFTMAEVRIKSGDRVAVLGSNGCGKSTLLNLLYRAFLNREDSTTANSQDEITFHQRCRLGYYDQSLNQLSDSDTLAQALSKFAAMNDETCKRSLISAGFEYSIHDQKVETLSGGERARLLFVGLTLAKHHMLFLDEPTNHLDMEGKEELIDTLNDFEGATLVVSHDRNLIEQSCNRFWFIEGGVLTEYLSVEEVYDKINEQPTSISISGEQTGVDTSLTAEPLSEEEQLLERLILLEGLLEEDLNRKAKHQKPQLQQQWRDEIDKISALI